MKSKKPLKGLFIASDVDGTITADDTIFGFFKEFGLQEDAEKLDAACPGSDVSAILDKITSKKPVKRRAFVNAANKARLFSGAKSFFSKLERKGASVCLVTATYGPIAVRIAERLGLQKPFVIATRVSQRNGLVTGFKGPVIEGKEKEKALSVLLRRKKPRKTVGLGDSEGDSFFMKRIAAQGGLCFRVKKPRCGLMMKKILLYAESGMK
jgi:HAD superfamily phosphoserine phosphatase-like hydrolase